MSPVLPHYDTPKHWAKGALLDLKRFNNGTFVATLLGDEAKVPESITFDNSFDAQNFVSWWYSRPDIPRA